MVELNDRIIKYMKCNGFADMVLNIENITSWCAPPYWEVLVSFTDKDELSMIEEGYLVEETELGKVYYPSKGLSFAEDAEIKRMEYPWITCLEVDWAIIHKEVLEWEK